MNREFKSDLIRTNQKTKECYHELNDHMYTVRDKKLIGVRNDKLNRAFLLLDLAICEMNEALGKNRSD